MSIIKFCEELLLTLLLRKHTLEVSGAPLSGAHSLWECWSEDEQNYTIEIVLKVLL